MKPIKPYKIVPLSDEELEIEKKHCETTAAIYQREPRYNRWMLELQTGRATEEFLSNFPIGSQFDLNGFSALVFKHVKFRSNYWAKHGEAPGITLLIVVQERGVATRMEHLHLTMEFLREYTKDWPTE